MGKRLLGFGLAVSLALGSAFWQLSLPTSPQMWPPVLQGEQAHWVWGRVASLTRSGPHSVRFAFEIQGVRRSGANGAHVRLQHTVKVWVTWPRGVDDPVQVSPGEVWLLPLRWRAAAIDPHPGGFNAPLWLKQQGLLGFAQVVTPVQSGGQARLLKAGPLDVQHLRQSVRDHILKSIADHRRAALVVALSMGDQNAIDQEDWDVFRRAGVAHLVSISGLHVTLLAHGLAVAMASLWRRLSWCGAPCALYLPAPLVAQIVTLVAAALYAVFSGWGLPAQRTVWTLLALQGLRGLGCTWPPHAVWLALMACIAVFDPYALSQSGFWLSYVAVGLLYGLEPADEASAWRQWWAQTWVLQWQITLVLMPMSMYFFQGVSVAGLWVNLWAIPWVTWVVTPLSLMGMWLEPLWTLAGWAVGWLLMGLDWAAQSPWALAEASAPPLWGVILATISAMLAIQPGPWAFRAWCGSLMLPLLWWS